MAGKVGEYSKDKGMSSGPVERFKDAGSDPYNKAGKAEGRDASSW